MPSSYIVIETHNGCTPEIPTRLFPSWEDAMLYLRDVGQTAGSHYLAAGEDPWGNGTSGLQVTEEGTARVWGNGEDPVWSAIVARIPTA